MKRAARIAGLIGIVLLALALVAVIYRGQRAPVEPAAGALGVYHGELELLAMPDAGSAPLLQAIDGARESIRLKIYLITSNEVVAALQGAAQRGVSVRVLIEEEPFGGGETNALASQELAAGGVQVRARPPVFVYSHEKSLVVDDRRVYIMTHNLTNSSFNRNREYLAIVEDPTVVAEVAQVFDADWERVEPDLSAALLVWSPVNSRQRLESLVDSALVSLDVQHTSLLDERLIDRLAAAAQRGVRVRVTTPAILDPSEMEFEPIKKLAAAGVGLRFLDTPYVHAKALVVDGQTAMIGSQNLTANSLENNRELGIVFDDVAAVNRLARVFLQDWNNAEPWGGPEPTATLPAGGILRWDQTAGYVGQTVTVEGEVIDTYDSGKVTFLNFDDERTFTVVIFASDYPAFAQPPEDLYWRKRVQVTGQLKPYQGKLEIIVDTPEAIAIVEDLLLTSRGGQPAATAPASGVVDWQDAGEYLGQRLTVQGEVVRVYNSGKAAFLNFAEAYQGQFSVVIFAADFEQWPEPPDQVYLGQRVQVSGKIKEYQGAPEMIVESPDQIVILGPAALAGLPTEPAAALAGLPTEPAAALAGLPTEPAAALDGLPTEPAAALAGPPTEPAAALDGLPTEPAAALDGLPTEPATALAGLPTEPALVAWQDAAAYEGQPVVVEGLVVDSYRSDSVIFLNFSDDRSQFKAVIFQRDWVQWPQSPDQLFLGQTVRISGPVVLYEGAPEIIVNEPAQIEIVGQPAAVGTPVPPPVIAWQDAAAYAGQRVTVEGVVVDTYKSDKVIFLNFSRNRNDFKAVIFASAWPRWQQAPDELYFGQTLRITGQVKLYEGVPEIIVDEPAQVEVVER
jgi:cardiolipin synthase